MENTKFKVGDIVILKSLNDTEGLEDWIKLFNLVAENPIKVVTMIFRRPSDSIPVLKALELKGYCWRTGDDATKLNYFNSNRVLTVNLREKSLGFRSFGYDCKPSKIIDIMTNKYGVNSLSTLFIRTKPSVNVAINEMLKYI